MKTKLISFFVLLILIFALVCLLSGCNKKGYPQQGYHKMKYTNKGMIYPAQKKWIIDSGEHCN
jgi:uncharacterized protein YceK